MITATCQNADCGQNAVDVNFLGQPSTVVCGECGDDCLLSDSRPDPVIPSPPADAVKRRERDDALAASDFRMVSDAPWDTTAWATYRQALRDLPDHADWPDVDLPTPPGGDS